VQSLHRILGSTHDIGEAEEILEHILELFADAEGVSTKLKDRVKHDGPSLLRLGTWYFFMTRCADYRPKDRTGNDCDVKQDGHFMERNS
jgi:hypothetical protein